MKKTILLFLILLISSSSYYGAEDNYKSRIEAAKRYLNVLPPIESMLEESISSFKNRMGGDKNLSVEILNNVDKKKFINMIIQKLVTHFTTKELNALTQFYSSTEGKSIMIKYPQYMVDVQIEVNKELMKAMKKIKNEENNK